MCQTVAEVWENYMFFFNDTATTEIYTLSLHDALPICPAATRCSAAAARTPSTLGCSGIRPRLRWTSRAWRRSKARSEEHTSELQSRQYLVCRLLLEKKTNISLLRLS